MDRKLLKAIAIILSLAAMYMAPYVREARGGIARGGKLELKFRLSFFNG
jgi:hypothetical protein